MYLDIVKLIFNHSELTFLMPHQSIFPRKNTQYNPTFSHISHNWYIFHYGKKETESYAAIILITPFSRSIITLFCYFSIVQEYMDPILLFPTHWSSDALL